MPRFNKHSKQPAESLIGSAFQRGVLFVQNS